MYVFMTFSDDSEMFSISSDIAKKIETGNVFG